MGYIRIQIVDRKFPNTPDHKFENSHGEVIGWCYYSGALYSTGAYGSYNWRFFTPDPHIKLDRDYKYIEECIHWAQKILIDRERGLVL